MKESKSKLLQAALRVREEIYSAVKAELKDDSRTYREVAEANFISVATVQRIAASLGISRQVGPRPQASTLEVSNGSE
jgi:transcription initiation factor TFIIIB Brf1 subunit/transcription initiation factor TFIIB